MSKKARLKRLEQLAAALPQTSAPAETPLGDGDTLLVDLLGRTDALFAPCRDFGRCKPANCWLGRKAYAAAGLPYHVGGVDAQHQHGERLLADLIAAGLVEVTRNAVRATSARLTPKGEARARSLCGLPALLASLSLVAAVRALMRFPPALLTDRWVSEVRLYENPKVQSKSEVIRLQDLAAPALCRSWLDSNASVKRQAYYTVTPAGVALLESALPLPPEQPDLFREAAWKRYGECWNAHQQYLDSAVPTDTAEIGICPLPVSIFNVPFGVSRVDEVTT